MAKQAGKMFLKIGISAGLMALLLWRIDFAELSTVFRATDLWLFGAATALFFVQQVVVAYSWQILLVAQHNHVPFWRILQVHFIGSFFGTFMPSSVGMDIVRAYSLSRHLRKGVDAMSSLFVTRVVGFLVNFGIAVLAAIPVARMTGNSRLFWAVLAITALFGVGVWVLLHPRFMRSVEFMLKKIRLGKLVHLVHEFYQGTADLKQEKKALRRLVLVSLLFQVVGIYIIYLVGVSLGLSIAMKYYFIYVPVITVITVLPLSIAGIGVREGAFVFFFTRLGAAGEQALSLSLLVFAQWIAMALVGGMVYWLSGLAKARVEETGSGMENHVLESVSREG